MGVVWFIRSDGKRIHMPVVGNDVNTPDTAIPVSAASSIIRTRCSSGTVQVVVPVYGTITIDFSVPGRTGSCIQCGQCCMHPSASCPTPDNCGYVDDTDRGIHRCQYLTIKKVQGKDGLGKEDGTECSIYANLLDSFKGCLHGPQKPEEKWVWMTSCGYTFG